MYNHMCFFLLHFFCVLVLTVTAEHTLSGKVINKSGNPVEGALIKLQSNNHTVTSWYDGTFELNMVSVKNQNSHFFKNNIRIHNGILSIQNTVFQNIILDIFNLNGRKICVLQNGRLKPGLHHFPIPEIIGNQILLLRSKIGSFSQVYKLTGNSNTILMNESASIPHEQTTADATIDKLIVSHKDYDDVTIQIDNYNENITVQMIHNKLSFEHLNAMKIGDTLWNSSNQLKIIFDSLADFRCCCSCFCQNPGAIQLYLTLVTNDGPNQIHFSLPDNEIVTAAGFKMVQTKISPSCPSSIISSDYQDYSISFGIISVDSLPNILFLNFKRYSDLQILSGTLDIPICLPLIAFTYSDDKIISGVIPELSDSSKILYGNGQYISIDGEAVGATNSLIEISTLPWNNSDISISSISPDGSLQLSSGNQPFTLATGEVRLIINVVIDSTEDYIIKTTNTDSLTNCGFLYPWQISR